MTAYPVDSHITNATDTPTVDDLVAAVEKAEHEADLTTWPANVPTDFQDLVPLPPTGWYDIAASIRHSASAVRS